MILRRFSQFIRNSRLGAALASLAVVAAFSLAPIYLAGRYEADQRHALAAEAERHLASRIGQSPFPTSSR